MRSKAWSGPLGIIVGGAWLASNFRYFDEPGFTAIGMPLSLVVVGGGLLVSEMRRSVDGPGSTRQNR